MLKILNPDGAPAPVGPYSVASIVEGGARTAFIAGQVSADGAGNLTAIGDFRGQFRDAFQNLGRVLQSLGASFDDVAYTRGHLTRAEDLPAYREERERFFAEVCKAEPPPTTTLVVAGLYHPDCLFEIDAVAILRT